METVPIPEKRSDTSPLWVWDSGFQRHPNCEGPFRARREEALSVKIPLESFQNPKAILILKAPPTLHARSPYYKGPRFNRP